MKPSELCYSVSTVFSKETLAPTQEEYEGIFNSLKWCRWKTNSCKYCRQVHQSVKKEFDIGTCLVPAKYKLHWNNCCLWEVFISRMMNCWFLFWLTMIIVWLLSGCIFDLGWFIAVQQTWSTGNTGMWETRSISETSKYEKSSQSW